MYKGRRPWLSRTYSEESDSNSSHGDSGYLSTRHGLEPTSPARSTTGMSSGRSPSPQRRERPFEVQTPGKKLAQEIHDEFLVCKICLEAYKSPKTLNCLHTFCEQCIESHVSSESTYKKYSDYREFTCPICRKRTTLPIGGVKKLPDNFIVSSLTEIVQRQKPSKFPFCDICKMIHKRHKEATSKCLDCAKLLCSQCVTLHKDTNVTKNHSIFDVEIEKDIECKEHQDEVVRFYCEVCETCICVLCTFNEHKDHEITQFKEAVAKYKKNIQGLLGKCETKISTFDSHLEALNKCEENIKQAEQKIHDTAIKYISEIRNREKQLIEEIQNLYGAELLKQIESKKNLSTQVDGLRSTCSLTEVILKGKDIELLLLKKDVQEKLNVLNDVEIKKPPETVSKRVKFESGQIDLGFIHDKDRPVLSKMRQRKSNGSSSKDEEDDWPDCIDRATQTDKELHGRGQLNRSPRKRNMTESDDSDSGSDLETDDEEETEDETDDDKPELVDSGVQTEQKETSDSSSGSDADDSGPETTDGSTMTDKITTEDKGVNTRSRSLQSIRKADDTEDSLAARRRRRRERAHTTYVNSGDLPDSDENGGHYERRKARPRSLYNQSLDENEIYYDANASGKRV